MMQDSQDMILRHCFNQQIPKSISDRIIEPKEEPRIPGKVLGPKFGQNKDKNLNKDILIDNDKSHLRWRIKEGKNYSNLFYRNQKKCPKTKDGQSICMKLFLHGFFDKSCTHAHKLTKEEEINFDNFVNRRQEGGTAKPDF